MYRYLYHLFGEIEFWLELDDENYATRQITVENSILEISCKHNNLAEGSIELEDLEGTSRWIEENEFESKWNEALAPYQNDWQELCGLKNWYLRDKEGYKGLHVYFKNKNNFYFPWELQIWDAADVEMNITIHERFKRNFL